VARNEKRRLVSEYLDRIEPDRVWDLGANTGEFSRLAAERGAFTVAFDLDPACVEVNYLESTRRGATQVLPLVIDLTNPSPAAGWHHRERMSLLDRGPADVVLALALIHHLAIAGHIPLEDLAAFFHQAGRWLIIEFVPEDDPQAARLLAARGQAAAAYDRVRFERSFLEDFDVCQSDPIAGSARVLYLMRRRERA
jgi:hypothetical protein